MFRSLKVRNFRFFASGQVLSVLGTWMMVVAQDWLVLERGGGSTGLATVTAAQFAPLALFMLLGGRLADRYDKRRLLVITNTWSGLLAAVLSFMVLTDRIELPHIYLFAVGLGLANAVEMPTRMSFLSELVGPELLPNASALTSAYFNLARVVGTGLVGALIAAVGVGWVMALNAVSYLATIAGLAMIRAAELHRVDRPARALIRDGLRYVAGRRDLVVAFSLVLVVGLFGMNFQVTLPLLARDVFGADATSFGLVSTAFAAGALLSALVTTGRRRRPSELLLVGTAIAFGLLEVLTGAAPSFPVALGLLFLLGFASITFAQAANHRIQLGSDPVYRGRVLALYSLILQGTTPLGALLIGWLTALGDPRWGFYAGGLVSTLAALVVLVLRRRSGREVLAPARRPEPGREAVVTAGPPVHAPAEFGAGGQGALEGRSDQ